MQKLESGAKKFIPTSLDSPSPFQSSFIMIIQDILIFTNSEFEIISEKVAQFLKDNFSLLVNDTHVLLKVTGFQPKMFQHQING